MNRLQAELVNLNFKEEEKSCHFHENAVL